MEVNVHIDKSYLAHYGTKGMKWGVWNDETKRKYGLLKTSVQGGGGGVGDDDDEEEEKTLSDYSPYTEEGKKNRETMADWLIGQGVKGIKDVVNQHLIDIQTGNIDRGEARVIGIVNATAGLGSGTGEALINNPKGEEMGVSYSQRTKKIRYID